VSDPDNVYMERKTADREGWVAQARRPSPGDYLAAVRSGTIPWLTREDIVRLVLTLVRLGLLLVLTVMTLSLVIAVGRPETGPFEKFVLVAAAAGLILAIPVGRIARNR
jgi:hypothetical protein